MSSTAFTPTRTFNRASSSPTSTSRPFYFTYTRYRTYATGTSFATSTARTSQRAGSSTGGISDSVKFGVIAVGASLAIVCVAALVRPFTPSPLPADPFELTRIILPGQARYLLMRSRGERLNLPTISPPLPDNVYLRPNPPPPNLGADQWSRANRLLVLELARRRETAREDFLFLDEEDGKERPAMREIRLWETKGTIPLGVQIFTPCASRPHSTSFSSSSSSSSHGVPILPYTPLTERRMVCRTVLLVLPRPKDGDGVGGVPELEVGLEVMELMEDGGVEPDDDGEKEKDGWV